MCQCPEKKDQHPSVRPISLAFMEGRSRQCKASLPGKEPQGQFIGRHMFTRRAIREVKLCLTGLEQKKGGWTGFIFWSVLLRRSRCRGQCRSRSSYQRFAAGGGRSVAMMPDQSQRGRPPAMFRSSGLFAGGLCCLIRAKPFSLAWRKAQTKKYRGQKRYTVYNMCPQIEKQQSIQKCNCKSPKETKSTTTQLHVSVQDAVLNVRLLYKQIMSS